MTFNKEKRGISAGQVILSVSSECLPVQIKKWDVKAMCHGGEQPVDSLSVLSSAMWRDILILPFQDYIIPSSGILKEILPREKSHD